MVYSSRMGVVLVVVAMLAAACNSSDTQQATTTTVAAPLATLAGSGTASTLDSTTSTTSLPKSILTAPEYKIVDRIESEVAGDTVIVLLDPESYESLTDLDLYDLIAEVVELFPPVSVVHVVDDAAAGNVVANPDASEAERQAIRSNYLARLDDGFQITYLGPFASSGTAVLGS